jgi:hypothetical protein
MSEISKLYTGLVPEGTSKFLAQFNKITGEFIALLQPEEDTSILNNDFFNYTEVEMDLATQELVGTYDNFQIVNIQDQPVTMYEAALDNAAQFKIDKSYGVYKRLEVQEQLLEKLAVALNVEDEAFLEMRDYIAEVRANNKLYKESLMNDPTYKFVTLEEERTTYENRLEGGIHELIGPRELSPDVLAKPEV